jgi:uncharacterized protein (DUF1778 family)
MARPALPESERRSEIVQTRVTKEERKQLEVGAKAADEQVAEFIRGAALEKAERVLSRKAKAKSRP